MFLDQVQPGAADVMYRLKVEADADSHPNKVDLGVGIYRNEAGVYHELSAVKLVRIPSACRLSAIVAPTDTAECRQRTTSPSQTPLTMYALFTALNGVAANDT